MARNQRLRCDPSKRTELDELSPATVGSQLDAGNRNDDVLAYVGLWLGDAGPILAERLAGKAASGVSVRSDNGRIGR